MVKMNASVAWQKLLDKYDIQKQIKNEGTFKIKASQIKEFREPRLMAKWDSSKLLPSSLKDKKINLLPDSRNSYVLSDFILYENLPELTEQIQDMSNVILPELETIDIDNITSEANAINMLKISGILEEFLELEHDDILYSTFDGRMSSGEFDFEVDSYSKIVRTVKVNKAQIEVDAGFESEKLIVILEAKNVLHEDFHIRQLYYPYRLWEAKVSKPIRLIFSIYTNKIFHLLEYSFDDTQSYSSIKLKKLKSYSFENTDITLDELISIYKENDVCYFDDQNSTNTPFIQADNFDRIISLLENMYDSEMTGEEIEELMQFTSRQRDYYFNAGKYLGLFEKSSQKGSGIKYKLTDLGVEIYKENYKNRQLRLVKLILSHKIFNTLFKDIIESGELPSKEDVIKLELEYNVCSPQVADRRAGTVIGWLKWIFKLPSL